MNPVTIQIYDLNHNKVTTKFLEMCACPSSTAEDCTSCGVDNTSANIGIRNSIKNGAIFFNGCPCHIIHNAGQKASNAFTAETRFNVKEFVVDLFYWFNNSTKKKNGLSSFFLFIL